MQKQTPTVKLKGIAGGTWEHVTTLEGCGIYKSDDYDVCRIAWIANMTIDCDGSGGNPDNDPYYQDDTSLHFHGEALNAYEVPFVVVPPKIIGCVVEIVLGSQGVCMNLKTGLSTPTVTGDIGPSTKIGEASCECANRIGLSGNPNHGGTMDNIIAYMIWPGIAATVDKITYDLQSS
jgi:hypothetical protein